MNKSPRFSILIPTYNRKNLVQMTVDSVLAQSFTDFELIVVDDGSSDETAKMIESYGARVRLMVQKNSGPELARRNAAAAALGDYLVLLDDDDLLYPWALAAYDRLILAENSPAVICASVSYFQTGEPLPGLEAGPGVIEFVRYRDYLSKDVSINHFCSQIVIKRSEAAIRDAFRIGAWPYEPPDILLRLCVSSPFIIIRRPNTICYRLHAHNTMKRKDFPFKAFLSLARAEARGEYPGGKARRSDRRAMIGGMALFSTHWAWRSRQFRLAGYLILRLGWMMPAGLISKLQRYLRKPTPAMQLPAQN